MQSLQLMILIQTDESHIKLKRIKNFLIYNLSDQSWEWINFCLLNSDKIFRYKKRYKNSLLKILEIFLNYN